MATRKRSDRAAARDRAQERSATIGDPPPKEPPMQAPPQPDPSAPVPDAPTPGQHSQAGTLSAEAVARRAYDLYQQRGGGDGRDLDDWLQAERDLQQR